MTRFGHKLNYVINTFVKHTPDTGIFAMFYLLLDIQTFMQKFIINNIYIYYSKSQIHAFWKDNS